MLVDTPFPMKWVGDSPYKRRYRNSPFTYFVEWNHQSQHRSGFHALSGGRLMVLKGLHPGGDVRTLSPTKAQADGAIFRPDISFDGKKVLFSYRAESEMNYHIYEMNVDGAGLKQLTFGNYDDNDPIYLPDGHIMFVTTRGNTYIRCTHYSPSTVLARCDGDGKNIYLVSQNNEPDWIPSLLDDGRVVLPADMDQRAAADIDFAEPLGVHVGRVGGDAGLDSDDCIGAQIERRHVRPEHAHLLLHGAVGDHAAVECVTLSGEQSQRQLG